MRSFRDRVLTHAIDDLTATHTHTCFWPTPCTAVRGASLSVTHSDDAQLCTVHIRNLHAHARKMNESLSALQIYGLIFYLPFLTAFFDDACW